MNRRNLAIVALCCLPTIAITTVVAQRYSSDERGVGGSPASAAHVDEAVGRVVAQPMRPGEPVGPAAVVASVSYEGDVAGLPKTAAVFVFARAYDATVGRHDFHRANVVARPPVLPREVTKPPAECETGDARRRYETEHGGEAMDLGFAVDVVQEASGLGMGDTLRAL